MIGGRCGVVVLFFAGIFVYASFINDSPDALDENDLAAALPATTEAEVAETTTAPTDESTPTTDQTATTAAPTTRRRPPTPASMRLGADHRVRVRLPGQRGPLRCQHHRGRSQQPDRRRLLTIEGTMATAVDIDGPGRQHHERRLPTRRPVPRPDHECRRVPDATFALTEPIEFGPSPSTAQQVVADRRRRAHARGVDQSGDVRGHRQTADGRIGVLGASRSSSRTTASTTRRSGRHHRRQRPRRVRPRLRPSLTLPTLRRLCEQQHSQ